RADPGARPGGGAGGGGGGAPPRGRGEPRALRVRPVLGPRRARPGSRRPRRRGTSTARMLSRRAAVVFGVADLVTAALVAVGVFVALPARWAPVDVCAAVVIAADVASGVGLLRGAPWAARVARAASALALTLGLALVTTLAVTASWLSGVYGPVGKG